MKKTIAIAVALTILTACKQEKSGPANAPPTAAHAEQKASQPQSLIAKKTYDGPFGLAMGIPGEDLMREFGLTMMSSDPTMFTGKPPKPMEGIDEYIVFAAPKAGVCRVIGIIEVKTVNGSGDQVKAETDKIADLLQIKYGEYSDKSEYIVEDVYRRNPQYWMMGLKEDSVFYAYTWTNPKRQERLPNQLKSIEAFASASRTDSATVVIRYSFDNITDCHKEIKAVKAQSL